jgi:hypothetical protein
MWWDCCGLFGRRDEEDERTPLLPQYRDETVLQRELHQKLHTYQMLRALSKGFMPSNEQTLTNLRTLLASDILNPENQDLSASGRALVYYMKQWLTQFIATLQHKNSEDQIQDFMWYLSKAKLYVDVEDIANRASKAKSKANTAAAYKSIQTVGSLLLTNSDFRLFLSDLGTIGREVFQDTALALSDVSKEVGKRLEPTQEEQEALKHPGEDAQMPANQDDLTAEVAEVTDVVAQGASKVLAEAEKSIADKAQGGEKDALVYRLKQAVTKLRKRPDYSDSVSTLSLLLKRYAMVYSHFIEDTVQTAEQDIGINLETDEALRNFWSFLTSFGDAKQWHELESRFKKLMEDGKSDPEFDELVRQTGNAVQELLTDPSFFDHAEERFEQLRTQSRQLATESSLRNDLDGLLVQMQATFQSVVRDQDIAKLLLTSKRILKILSPAHQYTNTDLVTDSMNVFVPFIIQACQYVPIPRLEIGTPEADLLLENLILEPGTTVNNSSFLPYKLRIETRNDLEVRKARYRTTSSVQSVVTVKVEGISVAAQEIGYWLRLHSGLLWFGDEGIASINLDEKGIDVEIEVEVGKEKIEKIVTLREVRVKIHKLNYTLRKSKLSLFAWLFKPLIRPIIRKALELQIAASVAEGLHFLNRELLFARERLRATQIANPDDLFTFVKAVVTRLLPEEDPDLYTRVGVAQPGKGVFKGVYAPGSIVKVWNEEAMQANDRIREYEREGWRNRIFDVHVQHMT